MTMNLHNLLSAHFTSVEEIAESLNMDIKDDTVISNDSDSNESVSLTEFEETLEEYISEGLEDGINPEYIIQELCTEYNEAQDVFKEMLFA